MQYQVSKYVNTSPTHIFELKEYDTNFTLLCHIVCKFTIHRSILAIVEGYGIKAATMAKLPSSVIEEAFQIRKLLCKSLAFSHV